MGRPAAGPAATMISINACRARAGAANTNDAFAYNFCDWLCEKRQTPAVIKVLATAIGDPFEPRLRTAVTTKPGASIYWLCPDPPENGASVHGLHPRAAASNLDELCDHRA